MPSSEWLKTIVAEVLHRLLGAFVHGIDADHLRLDAVGGDITLRSLSLNLEAFSALDLPLAVTGGTIRELRVKVPWTNLGK